jgi:hypothetical protein
MAHLALQAFDAAQGDWRALLGELERGRSVGALVDGLGRGWAWQGLGEPANALSAFDELAAGSPGLRAFGLFHKAWPSRSRATCRGPRGSSPRPSPKGSRAPSAPSSPTPRC